MNYFKNEVGSVYAYDDEQVSDGWVEKELIPMSEKEIKIHLEKMTQKNEPSIQASVQKQNLVNDVNVAIGLLQSKLLLGRMNEGEKKLLNQWLDYLDKLDTIDVSLAPDIDWPIKPE
ncbi:tail fiber assembly protein [Proteus mirabilis]|uniref:tail fiber assembly protein n=1 Tax=Proteus mirabilis TaxID=584 RepID=UPI0034D6A232